MQHRLPGKQANPTGTRANRDTYQRTAANQAAVLFCSAILIKFCTIIAFWMRRREQPGASDKGLIERQTQV